METLQPTLRFPEFSGDWINGKIGDYFKNLKTGMTPSRYKPEYFKGNNLWITSGELNYDYIEKTNERITDDAVKKTNLKVYEPNTLFIAITGLEAPGTRGKCGLNKYLSTTNQSCMAFEKIDNISNVFLFFWYQKYGVWLYTQFAQGSKQQSFNNKIVEKFIFIHPLIPEQTKIANFLTEVDTKINQLTKKKTLLEQYKKGVMQQLFSQELRFKDENGNAYPDWEEKTLGEIGEIITGKTPKTQDLELWNGDIQFVTPTDIIDDKYQFVTQRTIKELEKTKVLPSKSIMFTCIASIGKMSLSIKPCVTNQQINSLIPKDNYDKEYVYYGLLNIVDYIKSTQSTNTLPIINKTEFSKFEIMVPKSKEEQTKIANFLSAIDDKITAVNNQLIQTQQFKKGLLQQLFV